MGYYQGGAIFRPSQVVRLPINPLAPVIRTLLRSMPYLATPGGVPVNTDPINDAQTAPLLATISPTE